MKNIAIIPARSGSKGLPDKNIKELAGLPMMAYTIRAAIDSGKFDEVMVSTDSKMYAEIAMKHGAKVPFLRSEKNSSDVASSWDMVEEVLESYKQLGKEFDTFCLLQPTSPLRDSLEIKGAYNLYQDKNATGVVAVCEMEHSPRWCNTLDETLSMAGFLNEGDDSQRQKQGIFYRINGAIYIVDIVKFYKSHFIYNNGTYAYVMSKEKSVDVDCEMDFVIAEAIMSRS